MSRSRPTSRSDAKSSSRSAFRSGVKDVLPALPANVPFGIIAGIATIAVGFEPDQAVAFAGLLFAGAAQIAAIELLDQGAPVGIVVLTALVVNLRYVMYSASLGTYFEDLSTRWKFLVAFLLLDITFALSVSKFDVRDGADFDPMEDGHWYYLGTALPMWVTWVGASIVGIVFGAQVPQSWQLDFTIPLLFIGLLFPALDGPSSYLAGGVAGVLAIVGFGLPFNAGILVAALGGIVAGVLSDGVVQR